MMSRAQVTLLTALALSVLIHASVLWAPAWRIVHPFPPPPPPVEVKLQVAPPPKPVPSARPAKARKSVRAVATPLSAPAATRTSLAAPPPPSAEEWRLASTYTLKNSKRYRNAWGQQVRSQMGTAVEGPDQGQVRFRITINPDGSVAQVEELWSTSAKASELARKAIRKLPPLPPTPTGKPLVFEQTIAFLPYETGWPPSYKRDCLPDPPTFRNPYAWDGQGQPAAPPSHPADAATEGETASQGECNPDSTADSIEEEARELARQMDQNRWGR